jgi:hypothetical protein
VFGLNVGMSVRPKCRHKCSAANMGEKGSVLFVLYTPVVLIIYSDCTTYALLSQILFPGTPAKKRTIPHFPFPPLILEGFPAIKNLGSFRESSGRNFRIKKLWTSEVGGIPSLNVAIVAIIVAIVD